MDRPVGPLVPAGVHAVGRARRPRSGPRRWRSGSRAAGRAGRPGPRRHAPRTDGRGAGRELHLTAGEGPADGGRGDRLLDAVVPRQQLERADLEVGRAPSSRSNATLPWRWWPKWKSSPTTTTEVAQGSRPALAARTTPGSSCRGGAGRTTTRTVASTPVAASSSSFCGRSVSSRGADSGRTTLAGWRSKVTTTDRRAQLVAQPADLGDHGLVAEMDAVVGADGDDRPLAGPRARRQIGDDVHRPPTLWSKAPASTTQGLASSVSERLVHRQQLAAPDRASAHGGGPSKAGSTRPVRTSAGRSRRRPSTWVQVAHRLRRPGAARTSCGGCASARVNEPDAVRRRCRRWAPTAEQPAEVGGERADVGARRAVDLDPQHERIIGRSTSSNRRTVTGRAARSTSMPSRASSWRRRPPTFTADTIGGTCRMSAGQVLGRQRDARRRP